MSRVVFEFTVVLYICTTSVYFVYRSLMKSLGSRSAKTLLGLSQHETCVHCELEVLKLLD